MNLIELYDVLNKSISYCKRRHQDPAEIQVCIKIDAVNEVGGTPNVNIKSAFQGVDWDSGRILLVPEEDLTLTDHDYLTKLRKEAQDMKWTAYEVGNLKRENKKLLAILNTVKILNTGKI